MYVSLSHTHTQVPPHVKDGIAWLLSGCWPPAPKLLFLLHALQVSLYALAFAELRSCTIASTTVVYGCPQGHEARVISVPFLYMHICEYVRFSKRALQ